MDSKTLTPATMKRGGAYNWRNQPDRLIYLRRFNGWHQFKKIGDPREVWCEVRDEDLHMLEETQPQIATCLDDADERIGAGGMAAADAADDESENYNRAKDHLFQSVRDFMGWPGRPVKYLPEFVSPGRERVTPHPFEQEGGEG